MNRQAVNSRLHLDPDLHFVRPELAGLLALWEEKRGDRTLPDRSDFSPFILKPYLPRIVIYEAVNADPQRRFRFRLYGTLIGQHTGRDATGRFLDDVMPPETYVDFRDTLERLLTQQRPLRINGSLHYLDRQYIHFESICLPLTVEDRVEQILNVTYYDDDPLPVSSPQWAHQSS